MKRNFLTRTLLALTLALVSVFFAVSCADPDDPYGAEVAGVTLLNSEDGMKAEKSAFEEALGASAAVTIINGKTTDFDVIRTGAVSHASPAEPARYLEEWLYSTFKANISFEAGSSATDNLIVYGKVDNIPLTVRLAEEMAKKPADAYTWGIAYADGVLALSATAKTAYSDSNDLFFDLYSALEALVSDGKMAIPEGFMFVCSVGAYEYNARVALKEQEIADAEAQRRAERIEYIKGALQTEFKDSDFDPYGLGITTDMEAASGSSYEDPDVYPTTGEHPRVLFTSEDIPAIVASMNLPKNKASTEEFWAYANLDIGSGILPPAVVIDDGHTSLTSTRRGEHNFDGRKLGSIQAKAFAYAITGDEYYGYEAIYCMMNYLTTLDIKWIYSDQTREFGYVMYVAACVYDWCYDLLTETEKNRIALGVEHLICTGKTEMWDKAAAGGVKMEVGFPPNGQGSVTGHGSERQLLRDYLAFSIAVFDELPGWYDFIAGRIYEEYVPVREIYYEAGMYPQGVSHYANSRFFSDLFCAFLIEAFSGQNPFPDTMADIVPSICGHIVAGKGIFAAGDAGGAGVGSLDGIVPHCAMITAYLFNDQLNYNIAKNLYYSCYSTSGATIAVTLPEYLVLNTVEFPIYENTKNEMPLILYNGGYLGQYITRNSWGDDAAVTFVKANVRTTANHDHEDSGTFQIYYKGMLTTDTGVYASYGTPHFNYYHQATVAHNGILIVDPERAVAGSVYSGGQRTVGETANLDGWLTSAYSMATVEGRGHGYGVNGSAKYSYLKSNITQSYTAAQTSYVARTTLTAYTNDEDIPMVFFVFDRIDSAKAEFKKTFLLQVPGEDAPIIDQTNKTVTVTRDGGKLVLTSLMGGDNIEGIGGGRGKNFMINGTQVANSNEYADSWGRVEISTGGEISSELLNVIYVTDRDSTSSATPTLVSATDKNGKTVMNGASILGITALFANDYDRNLSTVKFTAPGEGLMTYYVGGLFEGTWKVSVDGEYVGTVYSTKESGLVTFKAPAGEEIKLTPGDDIQPEGSEKITYVTGGGAFDGKVNNFYYPGTEFTIPTNITRGDDVFGGWYLEPTFETKVETIPKDSVGQVTLYAKWSTVFFDEDYSETKINFVDQTSGNVKIDNSEYHQSDGATTTYKTYVEGEDGYLLWKTSGQGPSIFINPGTSGISNMSSDTMTYVFELASTGNGNDMTVGFRVRNQAKTIEVGILAVKNGSIQFANQEIAKLGVEFVTVAVEINFTAGTAKAYCSKSHEVYESTFDPVEPTQFTRELLSCRSNSAGEIKIGAIRLLEGDMGINYKGIDVPEHFIELPPEAIVADGVDISFTPNGSTVIPTEGITACIGGVYKKVAGWYSDAALTKPVTTVPDGVSVKYTVYAKWVDDDYIYYPEGLGLSPEKYTAGTTTLPTGVETTIGGIDHYLVGWYGNVLLSGNALTTVPQGKSGAYYVYAKWAEKDRVYFLGGEGVAPIDYVAGVTELPTGIVGTVEGFEMPLVGWYLDEALTQPITVVPANAKGAFFVYGKWQEPNRIKYPTDAILPAGFPTEYVAGETVLPTPTFNGTGYAEFCGWYSDASLTEKIEGGVIPEGTSGVFKVYAKWLATLYDLNVSTDATTEKTGNANVDTFTDANIYFRNENSETYIFTTVDNGDNDYVRIYSAKDKGGPNFNPNGLPGIAAALETLNSKVITYTMKVGANDPSNLASVALRLRIAGVATGIFSVDKTVDGKVGVFASDGTLLAKKDSGFINVTLVVDFDKDEIRYYIDDFKEYTVAWPGAIAGSSDMAQFRFFSAGIVEFSELKVVLGDAMAEIDIANANRIVYPSNAEFEGEYPKIYVAGETVLPTGVTAKISGYTVSLLGWYDNPELTGEPITVIPAGAVGEFALYAKWDAPAIIEYPDNVKLSGNEPIEYVAGETKLPENPTYNGTGNVAFCGWYLDEALTKPVVGGVIPEDSTGIVKVYAKWLVVLYDLNVSTGATTEKTGTANTDTFTDANIYFRNEDSQTYKFTTVDNGDADYIRIYSSKSNGGPNFNPNGLPGVGSALGSAASKTLTYQMSVGAHNASELASVSVRLRCGGAKTAFSVVKTEDGKVSALATDGKVLATKDSGLINISFVVDFDLDEVRYYVDGEYVYTSSWTFDWNGATDMAQFRFNEAGVVEFSELKVILGDAMA